VVAGVAVATGVAVAAGVAVATGVAVAAGVVAVAAAATGAAEGAGCGAAVEDAVASAPCGSDVVPPHPALAIMAMQTQATLSGFI